MAKRRFQAQDSTIKRELRNTMEKIGATSLRVDHGDKALILFAVDAEGEFKCWYSWSSQKGKTLGERFYELLRDRFDAILDEAIEELRAEEKL